MYVYYCLSLIPYHPIFIFLNSHPGSWPAMTTGGLDKYGILLVFVSQLQYSLWACESYWFLGSIQFYWHDNRHRLVLHKYILHKYRCYWILTNYFDKGTYYIFTCYVIAYTISNLVSPSSFDNCVSVTNMLISNIIYKIFVRWRIQCT